MHFARELNDHRGYIKYGCEVKGGAILSFAKLIKLLEEFLRMRIFIALIIEGL